MAEEIFQYLSPPLAAGIEITDDISGQFKLKCLITVNTITFLIYFGLTVFDIVSNWELLLDIRENGFNNPLLPPIENWFTAWFAVVAIGTILSAVSVASDGISLGQSCRKFSQKFRSNDKCKK